METPSHLFLLLEVSCLGYSCSKQCKPVDNLDKALKMSSWASLTWLKSLFRWSDTRQCPQALDLTHLASFILLLTFITFIYYIYLFLYFDSLHWIWGSGDWAFGPVRLPSLPMVSIPEKVTRNICQQEMNKIIYMLTLGPDLVPPCAVTKLCNICSFYFQINQK